MIMKIQHIKFCTMQPKQYLEDNQYLKMLKHRAIRKEKKSKINDLRLQCKSFLRKQQIKPEGNKNQKSMK